MALSLNEKSGIILPPPSSPAQADAEGEILFRGQTMQRVVDVAAQVAASGAPVLIRGESGTGKELFARLIHRLSPRRLKPFVPVNCGVLAGELFADKFFGHEPGAFTGAVRAQKGCFELAGDGTLFLDEVGEIPPSNQVDFLRILEERTYKRLGGEKTLPFLARIVAATNRDLPQQVANGGFRADLFYRLNVVPIILPPLRDRPEDVAFLAERFLERFSHSYHRQGLSFSPVTLAALTSYPWPGNVRELKNLVERLVLLTPPGGNIRPSDLPLDIQLGAASTPMAQNSVQTLEEAVRAAEIQAIRTALEASGGRKKQAASLLGIADRTLRLKLSQYGLRGL